MSRKPNILFLISDQHKQSAMGYAGNRHVKTPHLDRLAAESVYFENAYCSSPLCAPTRAALITGTHPYRNTAMYHTHKIGETMVNSGWHRHPGYREELVPMGTHFARHGYRTAAIGKMHVHGETRENRLGFQTNDLRFYTFFYEDYERVLMEKIAESGKEAPHSDNADLAMRKRLQYTGRLAPPEDRTYSDAEYDYSWTGQYNNADPEKCPATIEGMPNTVLTENDMFDVLTTEQSLDYLDQHVAEHAEKLFLLHVGLEKPHPPWTEMQRFMELYNADAISDEDLPLAWNEERRHFVPAWLWNQPGKERVKKAMAAYYANVTSMDEKVGQLLAKLEELGLSDDTIVVYTTDHGEMCYEHSQIEKHCMYEAAVKVPLMIRWPGKIPAGKRTDCLASHIDLLPTLGDLCGLPKENTYQGESLVPVLEAPERDRPDRVVYAEFTNPGFMGHPDNSAGPGGPPDARVPMRMIRTHDWKYIYTNKLPDQLYAVGSDEVYAVDNQSAQRRGLVKKLKRSVLAGWNTDGYLGRYDDERNLEDWLGDAYLPITYDAESQCLYWTCRDRLLTAHPATNAQVKEQVESLSLWVNEVEEMYTARKVKTVDFQAKGAIRLDGLVDAGNIAWLVAENKDSTLAVSRTFLV